jgi:hypothetical protein
VTRERTIERSIRIDRPPERVWAVLTDLPAHRVWNPFIREISGEIAVGRRLRVHIVPPGGRGMTFTPRVTAASPGRELAWLGTLGMPRLFDGAHSFRLRPTGDGGTELTQAETFRGLLVPLFGKGLAATAEGFELMNRTLKQRCERAGPDDARPTPDDARPTQNHAGRRSGG